MAPPTQGEVRQLPVNQVQIDATLSTKARNNREHVFVKEVQQLGVVVNVVTDVVMRKTP